MRPRHKVSTFFSTVVIEFFIKAIRNLVNYNISIHMLFVNK